MLYTGPIATSLKNYDVDKTNDKLVHMTQPNATDLSVSKQ